MSVYGAILTKNTYLQKITKTKNGTSHPHVIIKINKKPIGKNYPRQMEWDYVRIIHKNNYANENNKNLDLPLKLQEYREIFEIESPSQRTP